MTLIKRFRVINHFIKYGGTLTFEDKATKQTTTFTITKRDIKIISKMLSYGNKYYLLKDNHHNLSLHKSLDSIATLLHKPHVELKQLYYSDKVHIILNRKTMMRYIDSVNMKDKRMITNTKSYATDQPTPKQSKPFKKKKQKPRFDWHDHYLEGLRMHGNVDDAEAHADEMKANHDKLQ